jgi:D-alanyl-D-alanine carboxypeptidase
MNSISRRSALLAAVGALSIPRLSLASTQQAAWTAIDAEIEALVRTRVLAGGQIAVARHGDVLYSRGFGSANLETHSLADTRTVFRFASNTKQFTAAAILLLQESGALSVEDRLVKYLPDVPRAADITLRQMLNHVSGMGNYVATPRPETMWQRARIDYSSSELLDAVLTTTDPLYIAEPGERWAYSNSAYVMLGLVIEKASGRAYKDAISTLCKRAALTSTVVDDNSDVVPWRASGYSRDQTAASGFINSSYISMSYTGAAGSIRSTCEDFCRWHAALFGGRILNAESLRLMMEPARLSNGQLPTILYGMGLRVTDDPHGRCFSHGGGIQGFVSRVLSYPESGVTIALVTNTDERPGTPEEIGAAMDSLQTAATKGIFVK